jgi:ribosomal protein S18 acetylase RimI-like enzyme
MPLPILSSHQNVSTDDLVRLYHRTELHWVRQVAQETALDCGSAFTSASLSRVRSANVLFDGSIPDGATPADAVAEVEHHFTSSGLKCLKWVLNPALPRERTAPLAEHLLSIGYTRDACDILYLSGQPARPIVEVAGLHIIPARASYRHARELIAEDVARWNQPQLIEAGMLHLEDPQTDALLALRDGTAAALVSVLTVGEIGCVEDLFVSERFRGQGIGRTMMSRALEICARSLFRHVFLTVAPENSAAQALYANSGFRKIAELVEFRPPIASAQS